MRTYDAFISYSHARDKPIAVALQTVVQTIGKAWWQRRALRIFRDDTSLAASPHLWPDILKALDNTRYLILLASPDAAASVWVGKEIEHWLAQKGSHSVLIALTDGGLSWDIGGNDFHRAHSDAVPAPLFGRFEAEPRWVDLRPYREGGQTASKRNPDFLTRAADIAAAVHGVAKEDLLSDELRQQRRALATAWTAAAGLAGLAAVAGWQAYQANLERARVELALAQANTTANNLVGNLASKFAGRKDIPQKFILDILGEARTLVTGFGAIGGDRPELIETQAYALAELSKTLRAQGSSAEVVAQSQATAEAAVAAYEKLTGLPGAKPDWRRGLAASLDRLGDVLLDQGRGEDAMAVFRRSLATSEVAAQQLGEPGADDNVAVAHEKIGHALRAQGKLGEAMAEQQKSLAIRQLLLRAQPARSDLQRAMLVSHGAIADILLAQDKPVEAVAEQRQRLQRAVAYAAANADSDEAQHDLQAAHGGLGDALLAAGLEAEGGKEFEASLAIQAKLAAADPERSDWQQELAAALDRIGDRELEAGRIAAARHHFEEAERVATRLLDQTPDRIDRQLAKANAVKKMGDVLHKEGAAEAALAAYRTSLELRLKIPASDTVRQDAEIGQAFQFVSNLCVETGRLPEAARVAEQRVAHVERNGPQSERGLALGSLAWFQLFARSFDQALANAKAAEALLPTDELWIKANRAHAAMFAGDTAAARREYLAERGKPISKGSDITWEQSALSDFAIFRKAGLRSPLMDEIEAQFKT